MEIENNDDRKKQRKIENKRCVSTICVKCEFVHNVEVCRRVENIFNFMFMSLQLKRLKILGLVTTLTFRVILENNIVPISAGIM